MISSNPGKTENRPRLRGVSTFIIVMAILYSIACFPVLGFLVPSPGLLLSVFLTSLLGLIAPPGAAALAFAWIWISAFNFAFSVILIIKNLLLKRAELMG